MFIVHEGGVKVESGLKWDVNESEMIQTEQPCTTPEWFSCISIHIQIIIPQSNKSVSDQHVHTPILKSTKNPISSPNKTPKNLALSYRYSRHPLWCDSPRHSPGGGSWRRWGGNDVHQRGPKPSFFPTKLIPVKVGRCSCVRSWWCRYTCTVLIRNDRVQPPQKKVIFQGVSSGFRILLLSLKRSGVPRKNPRIFMVSLSHVRCLFVCLRWRRLKTCSQNLPESGDSWMGHLGPVPALCQNFIAGYL